jgi:hypothetical protein
LIAPPVIFQNGEALAEEVEIASGGSSPIGRLVGDYYIIAFSTELVFPIMVETGKAGAAGFGTGTAPGFAVGVAASFTLNFLGFTELGALYGVGKDVFTQLPLALRQLSDNLFSASSQGTPSATPSAEGQVSTQNEGTSFGGGGGGFGG